MERVRRMRATCVYTGQHAKIMSVVGSCQARPSLTCRSLGPNTTRVMGQADTISLPRGPCHASTEPNMCHASGFPICPAYMDIYKWGTRVFVVQVTSYPYSIALFIAQASRFLTLYYNPSPSYPSIYYLYVNYYIFYSF